MSVKTLTEDQVKMLIEDGTLSKAIDLVEQEKECCNDGCEHDPRPYPYEHFDQSLPEQRHILQENGGFSVYDYMRDRLVGIIESATVDINNVTALWIYRNQLSSQFERFVDKMLQKLDDSISEDIRSRYNVSSEGTYYRGGVGIRGAIVSKLNLLDFHNSTLIKAFLDCPTNVNLLVHQILYDYAVNTDMNVNKNSDNNLGYGIRLNTGRMAYEYYDDVLFTLIRIFEMAMMLILAFQRYDTKAITEEQANEIYVPKVFDMAEPLESEFNTFPQYSNHDDLEQPRKVYTMLN